MKSKIFKKENFIFLEIYPENRDEEIELVGVFLRDKVFVQDGLPKIENNRFKKIVFKLQEEKKEIRWYKGKYKVKVIQKSKGNWMVKALEEIPFSNLTFDLRKSILKGELFITIPRLLWKHKKLTKNSHGKNFAVSRKIGG